jgi:hypothetical protein
VAGKQWVKEGEQYNYNYMEYSGTDYDIENGCK